MKSDPRAHRGYTTKTAVMSARRLPFQVLLDMVGTKSTRLIYTILAEFRGRIDLKYIYISC